MRYVERWEGREVRVFKVVRWVEVPVSSATMTFEESMASVGSGPSKIGSNGGGMGVDVIFAGKGGTGGGYSEWSEDLLFKEGRRVGRIEGEGQSGDELSG